MASKGLPGKSGLNIQMCLADSPAAPRSRFLRRSFDLKRTSLLLRLSALGVILCGHILCFAATEAHPSSGPLRTLATIREVHELSAAEAARGYPVHLTGVVTFCDPTLPMGHSAMFVQDSTGSMYVEAAPGMAIGILAVGAKIDLRGISDPGGFKPIVKTTRIEVLGQSKLPPPVRSSLYRPQVGDGWMEVEGVVHAIVESGAYDGLKLALKDGTIVAKTVRLPGVSYTGLVDAKVRIRGNASQIYNRNRQVVGARMVFPNVSAIEVLEPPPRDPFALNPQAIGNLLRFSAAETLEHRVHLQGRVTLQWPGSMLCIRDASGGLCAETIETGQAEVGSFVDVAGFAAKGEVAPVLTDAVFRVSGAPASPEVERITADQAILGTYDSKLVEIDGTLIGRDRAASDLTLVLSSGKYIYDAILPKDMAGPTDGDWKEGSRVRIGGICSVLIDSGKTARGDGLEVPKSFRILMRSPADVMVLQGPSWWNAAHAIRLLLLALALAIGTLARVMILGQRVKAQTAALVKSEIKFRHMATHDGLTQLLNRNAILAELAESIEAAEKRGTEVCVAILDLDHFKRINDTHGHQAGDEVLRQAALRLSSSIRSGDAVGRYGGEEFLVVFRDMDHRIGIERCEIIRGAICRARRSPSRTVRSPSHAASASPTPAASVAMTRCSPTPSLRRPTAPFTKPRKAGETASSSFLRKMARRSWAHSASGMSLNVATKTPSGPASASPDTGTSTHPFRPSSFLIASIVPVFISPLCIGRTDCFPLS